MRYWNPLIFIVITMTSLGCSTMPDIKDEGGCKIFQRAASYRRVSVQGAQVRSIVALREFPASHFNWVSFQLPVDSPSLRGSSIMMEFSDGATPSGCHSSVHDSKWRLCTVVPADLMRTGFQLAVSAPLSIAADEVIRSTNEYWASRLACQNAVDVQAVESRKLP